MKTKFVWDWQKSLTWLVIFGATILFWVWLATIIFRPEPKTIDIKGLQAERIEYLNSLTTFTESEWNEFYPNLN